METSIQIVCSNCGKALKVKPELAGKRGKCPTCGTLLNIPAAGEPPPLHRGPLHASASHAVPRPSRAAEPNPPSGSWASVPVAGLAPLDVVRCDPIHNPVTPAQGGVSLAPATPLPPPQPMPLARPTPIPSPVAVAAVPGLPQPSALPPPPRTNFPLPTQSQPKNGAATIEVKTGFFPLAFLLFACTPRIVIDGIEHVRYWGQHVFDVSPGKHLVRIFFPYCFFKCGENSVEVTAGAGETLRINYWMPPWMFAAGTISVGSFAGSAVVNHPIARSPAIALSRRTGKGKTLRGIYRCWTACIAALAFFAFTTVAGIVLREQAVNSPEIRRLRDDWIDNRGGLDAFERYLQAQEEAGRFGQVVAIGSTGFAALSMLAMTICFCLLLYKLWEQVQDGQARATPGQALGFLFIPFFNLYWMFIATVGLAEELNRCARNRNLGVKPASSGLMATYCILTLAGIIPFVGLIAALVNLGVAIAAFSSATKVAVALSDAP